MLRHVFKKHMVTRHDKKADGKLVHSNKVDFDYIFFVELCWGWFMYGL